MKTLKLKTGGKMNKKSTNISVEAQLNKDKGDCEYLLIHENPPYKIWERNCQNNKTDFVVTKGKCSIPTWEMFEWDHRPQALRYNTRQEAFSLLEAYGLIKD